MHKMIFVVCLGDNVFGRYIDLIKSFLFFFYIPTYLHCAWVYIYMLTCWWSYIYACPCGILNLKSIYIFYCYLNEQQFCKSLEILIYNPLVPLGQLYLQRHTKISSQIHELELELALYFLIAEDNYLVR